MIDIALPVGFAAVALAMILNFHRLLRGPALPDRIIAIDTLFINMIALLMLTGLHFRSEIYFEAALLIAMLGFISTVALCKYVLRGDIIE